MYPYVEKLRRLIIVHLYLSRRKESITDGLDIAFLVIVGVEKNEARKEK